MKIITTTTLQIVAVALLGTTGCSGGAKTDAPPTTEGHASHTHPAQGPQQGELIELGDQEFHAELVHDEKAETVTIYILDGAAAKQVPIEAAEVTINAKHDGEPMQFTFAASPDDGDPKGMSSRFVFSDSLVTFQHAEESADARLVVTINGRSYRGVIDHDHDPVH